ncbi:MAG: cupin domain-containing protein [Nitrospira sp.]|nr:cupin domain-containing protein [Nitrospira sp.]
MTETRVPEELEEQAILHGLGLLGPEDRQAFMMKLQGDSDLLRQAAAYQAATDALASAVAPVAPPRTLRERLVNQIALEAAREVEQFELAATTLALEAVPVKPRDSVRERLLSRIEGHSEVRLDVTDSAHVFSEPPVRVEYGTESERPLPQDVGSLSAWLRSCRTAVSNFLRTLVIRSVTPRPSSKGLTFVKASEGTWWKVAPGVMAKLLSFEAVSRRTTTLLRFAPGTSYAPHRHTAVEELLVLEGGCRIAGREMTVGDYHRAEAGTEHHDTSSDDGCLLLVISSPQDEMLHEPRL